MPAYFTSAQDKRLGLTTQEAAKRLLKFGENILSEKPPPSDLSIFLSQFKNPLVYVLLAAALVMAVLGHYPDMTIILVAVFINTVLGFWQERRAQRALEALKKLVSPQAEVIRDGRRQKIDARQVVPGDVVVLNQGDKVAADGILVETEDLYVSEAILTGESEPVKKRANDGAFMGTVVVSGRGTFEVSKTGSDTQMGKIAESISEPQEETPLKRQLTRFSKKLAIFVGALSAFVFLAGFLRGESPSSMFTTSVALAVSAIPEGLLVSLTAVLAIGMQRILRKKGLVRQLLAAETLGGVTVICADKTGTLTEGKVRVTKSYFKNEELGIKAAILCNDLQDPLEVAMMEWAKKKVESLKFKVESLQKKYKRIDEIPFSSKTKFIATLHRGGIVFVSGAPEVILEWCKLSDEDKKRELERVSDLASQGLRLVGFAWRYARAGERKLYQGTVTHSLTWLGILVYSDPIREGVEEALGKAKKAGIEVKVITGDYPKTAAYVMQNLGFAVAESQIIEGGELAKLSKEKLRKKVKNTLLFARTTPEQKLAIVEALKARGEVVAMMGDGVNDAPALTRADIGIVVGQASDVARESADLVLLDSSFATIVAAIEEGRGIFDNIRKIFVYLLSDAFGEIIAVVGTIFLGLPLPLTAGQILWINLVSDGFPNLALTVDPKRKGIMDEPPHDSREGIVRRDMIFLIGIVSFVAGFLGLLVFLVFLRITGDVILSRSMAFLTLGVNSLFYVLSVRSMRQPLWKNGPFSNKWLVAAIVAGFVLQAIPFYLPGARMFFQVVPLSIFHWSVAFLAGFVVLFTVEFMKFVFAKFEVNSSKSR